MLPVRLTQITLITAFLLAITTPLLLFNEDTEFSSREKRRLASLPQWRWDWSLLNTYPSEFTTYFDDHYGLRSKLIKRSQHLKKKYFNKSPIWLVVRGQQGWLFMDKRDSIKDHIGQIKLEEATLARWQAQLLNKQHRLNQLGIEYFFAPIPNKMTLYSNYLPARIQDHSAITMLDQLLAYLTDKATFNAYIDLEDVLAGYQNTHTEQPLYFKTDTHWTSLGAFIAYQNIMQQLGKRLPELETALELSDMQREPRFNKGDLANIINPANQQAESTYTLIPKQSCASDHYTSVVMMGPGETTEPLEKELTVYNGCAVKSQTAVIVYDSFGEAIRPFFSESFKRVVFVSNYQLDSMERLLRKERPDVFLDLRVERNIRSLFKSDLLLQTGR